MEMWKWRINYVTAQEKPGLCPKPKPGQVGICVEACSGDGDCKGAKKCCSNGCGHVCMKPLGMYLNYQHPCSEIRRCTVVLRMRNFLACCLLIIIMHYALYYCAKLAGLFLFKVTPIVRTCIISITWKIIDYYNDNNNDDDDDNGENRSANTE